MQHKELPRILYLGNVPVELSLAGATLLYRLFEHYPKDKLFIIQQGVIEKKHEPRIKDVPYYTSMSKFERFRFTRFSKYLKGVYVAEELHVTGKIKKLIKTFKPDIIVTVSIRLMWVNALRFSKELNIPLHLILHDDWLTTENHGKLHKGLVKKFDEMYRHAAERYCISPTMEKYYYSMYGVHGKVIYPLRGKDDQIFPITAKKKSGQRGLKFCYAGSLYTSDFPKMLDALAYYIGINNGELHVFSNFSREILSKHKNLLEKHVIFHSFTPSSELKRIMNEEMDVAVLFNSFQDELPFRYNFTSKLVDYTAAGLPILFWGPASSGSMAWALSLGYDAIVTEEDPQLLKKILEEFNDEDIRFRRAKQMQEQGLKEFSYEHNFGTFLEGILKN